MGSMAYKIAAFEVNNHELIRGICSTKKPIVISRGMCTLEEMDNAVNIFEKFSFNTSFCIQFHPIQLKNLTQI